MACNIILDSGAFSADKNGTEVDIHAYMDYIAESGAKLYFNLDVINDVESSWKNQAIMEDAGFMPIPVFHVEEPVKWLYKCLDYEYMALGGMAGGVHENAREAFLDSCFDIICNTASRMPSTKVHGLGLASPLLVAKYPFYSADTASGIHYGRYGIIIIPSRDRSGKLDYLRPPHSLYVTERSTAKQNEGSHFVNKSIDEQEWILDYVESRGFKWGKIKIYSCDPATHVLEENEKFIDKSHTQVEAVIEEGIISNGVLRDYFNLDFYMNMESSIPEYPWPFIPKLRRMF